MYVGVVASTSLGTPPAETGGVPQPSTSALGKMPLSQRVCTYTECLLVMSCCFAGGILSSVNVARP